VGDNFDEKKRERKRRQVSQSYWFSEGKDVEMWRRNNRMGVIENDVKAVINHKVALLMHLKNFISMI
jgi:hypothetical protein